MQNIIRIKNAVFYAYHGALQEEQSIGGKYEADVAIFTDFSKAAESDNLLDTINYADVYQFINHKIHEKKYYLIETIASVIAKELLQKYSAIKKISVKIRKNNVPIGGVIDFVEAEVIIDRD